MFNFSKREWIFLIIIWLTVVILTFSPIVFGYINNTQGKFLLPRTNINGVDIPVYYSYIEQAKEGNLLFKNLFTSEYQPVSVFRPFWLLVGVMANIFRLSSLVAFQVARFLLIPIFLVIAYSVTSFFFKEEIKRKICFIFLVFSSGWGWIFSLNSKTQAGFLDWIAPEAFSFTTLYINPHFIASLSLIILIFLFSIKAFLDYKLKYSLLAGISALLLFSFHPYHIYTIFGVLFAFIIIDSLINKKIYFNYLKHFLIVSAFSLPPVLYHLWTIFNIDVVYQHYLQNITLTPPLNIVLISYGLLIPFAIFGIVSIFKNKTKDKKEMFLVVWFFTQFLLIYFPIKTQVRLVEGLQIVISILVVLGLFYIKEYLSKKIKNFSLSDPSPINKVGLFLGYTYLFFILFFISNACILYIDFYLYYAQSSSFYISRQEYEAMSWLKNTKDDSIILSGLYAGNIIPVFSSKQVFIGHHHETAQFERKEREVGDFFKNNNSQERLSFLTANGIDYLFFGIQEKRSANFNPDADDFLESVYSNDIVSIYKIK